MTDGFVLPPAAGVLLDPTPKAPEMDPAIAEAICRLALSVMVMAENQKDAIGKGKAEFIYSALIEVLQAFGGGIDPTFFYGPEEEEDKPNG